MKFFWFLFLSFLFSCTNNKQTSSDYEFNTDSVVVYGNLHLVGSEIIPRDKLKLYMGDIVSTQQWLLKTISEDIILLEGFPLDSQITFNHYQKIYMMEKYKNGSRPGLLDTLKRLSYKYEAQTALILEGNKKLFGSEDKDLYNEISLMVDNQPELIYSKDLLDARSSAMADNAKEVSMFYKRKVAIIVGDNHLSWFSDRGYVVHHPPCMRK